MAAPAPRSTVRRDAVRRATPRSLLFAGQAGLIVFVLLLVGYLTRFRPLLAADRSILDALAPYAVPGSPWVHAQEAVSAVFGPATFRVAAAVVGVIALLRGRMRAALFLVIGIGASGLLITVIKIVVDRPRPDEAVVAAFGSSFPSGHALSAIVGVTSFVLLLWPVVARPWRRVIVPIGALLVIAVGFSRLALAVHHLSDVVAGYGLGLAWVALAYAVTRPGREASSRPRRTAGGRPSGRDSRPGERAGRLSPRARRHGQAVRRRR